MSREEAIERAVWEGSLALAGDAPTGFPTRNFTECEAAINWALAQEEVHGLFRPTYARWCRKVVAGGRGEEVPVTPPRRARGGGPLGGALEGAPGAAEIAEYAEAVGAQNAARQGAEAVWEAKRKAQARFRKKVLGWVEKGHSSVLADLLVANRAVMKDALAMYFAIH